MAAVATNQTGWNVERLHPWPLGWLSVLAAPFDNKDEAKSHMDNMHKESGVEYRIYPALDNKK